MGSIGRVKISYTDILNWVKSQQAVQVYVTALDGLPFGKINKIAEGIIIIGNESKGVSDALMQSANYRITIPQKGKAESLNAAVAAGIILSQLT